MKTTLTTYCLLTLVSITCSHLLPEDLLSDDAEQIYREKRDSLFEKIFKTFPFFKTTLSSSPTEEPMIDNKNEMLLSAAEAEESNNEIIPLDIPDESTFFPADSVPTLHSFLPESTPFVEVESTPELRRTPPPILVHIVSLNNTSTVYRTASPAQTLTISPTPSTTPTNTFSLSPSGSTTTNTVKNSGQLRELFSGAVFHTSLSHATVIASNSTLYPTPSLSTYSEATHVIETGNDPVFQMMIMNEPRLPDERQYAENVFAHVPSNKDPEVKGSRYYFSTLFVPVMSGLFGALCITLIVIMMKCSRREKIRKIRYYGGKPESSLYRLDHMGLLSDVSSDEE